MSEFVQIVTTAPSAEDAERIAAALVERRLAACAQTSGPIKSVYRWQGATVTDTEWRLIAKTRAALFEQASAAIRELHSYETPQIVAVELSAVSEDYARWLRNETSAC